MSTIRQLMEIHYTKTIIKRTSDKSLSDHSRLLSLSLSLSYSLPLQQSCTACAMGKHTWADCKVTFTPSHKNTHFNIQIYAHTHTHTLSGMGERARATV